MKFISFIFFSLTLSAQVQYNHPEIDWRTFETENFRIHYYADTELSARKGAFIAESIFEPIVKMYQYRPNDKTTNIPNKLIKLVHCFKTIIMPVKNKTICHGTAKNIAIISLLFS